MDSTKREHLYQFPIKKLEKLIELAIKNNLSSLQIGDVTIVPGPQRAQTIPDTGFKLLEEAEKRKGRPLTLQESQDEILFGPGGFVKEDE